MCLYLGIELGCITPFSTIFQLYRGGQCYWWRKPEYNAYGEKHRPVESHWKTLSQMFYRVHLAWAGFELLTLVVICADCIPVGSCKSNYHTIMNTGADPGFQVRGAHLKKMHRAEGGAKIFGVFRVKNHDFTPKNHFPPPLDPPLEHYSPVSCDRVTEYSRCSFK